MSSMSSISSLLSSALSSSSSMSGSGATAGIDLSSLLQAATGSSSTGIDVNSAVAAALYADRAPEREWQSQQSTISAQMSTLTSLQTALSAVAQDLQDLNNVSGPLASRTVSSSLAQVNGSATAAAATGIHAVNVASLATTASWYSSALPGTATLGSSNLTVTKNDGTQTTFTTGGGINSLSDLANAINDSSIGISASAVSDASGSRLALISTMTGVPSDFSVSYGMSGTGPWSSGSLANPSSSLNASSLQISDGNTTSTVNVSAGETLSDLAGTINALGLNLFASVVSDPAGVHLEITSTANGPVSVSEDPVVAFTRASSAENASLTVDGVPVSSTSNTVSGVIPGLKLSLTGITPPGGPALINIGPDTNQISETLSKFVSDYNNALAQVNGQFTYSTSNRSQGVLSGDSITRSLQGMLEGIVSYSASSSASTPSSINSLADLGITVGDDGSLSLNAATLSNVLVDPASLQNFMQGHALNGFAHQFGIQLNQFADVATGSIAKEISNLNQQYSGLQSQINNYESGYIASQQTILTAMYSKAEIALQQLPGEMQQIQAQLGSNKSGN